jgi:protein-S-isoprenylcysteine O-methyltransferase Ste14
MAVTTATTQAKQRPAAGTLLKPSSLDRLEQLGILLFWIPFAWRMVNSSNPYTVWVMVSEFAIVVFTIFRRPTDAISVNYRDWMLAAAATFAPLLVVPAEPSFPLLSDFGLFLLFVGNIWQASAKLMLRRSFGIAPANRGVKVGGPYRYMRHPMYAGYLFVHIGALILMFSWYNLLVYLIGWTAQIRRLLAEERLLSADPRYAEYMTKVRWRLLPGIY